MTVIKNKGDKRGTVVSTTTMTGHIHHQWNYYRIADYAAATARQQRFEYLLSFKSK